MAERRLGVRASVALPSVPNFLLLADHRGESGGKLPLSAISDEELEEIGRAWTEELKIRAAEQRVQPAPIFPELETG